MNHILSFCWHLMLMFPEVCLTRVKTRIIWEWIRKKKGGQNIVSVAVDTPWIHPSWEYTREDGLDQETMPIFQKHWVYQREHCNCMLYKRTTQAIKTNLTIHVKQRYCLLDNQIRSSVVYRRSLIYKPRTGKGMLSTLRAYVISFFKF